MTIADTRLKPARGLGLIAHQVRYEQKSFRRNPAAAFFTGAFPIMFLVIFASLNKGVTLKQYDDLPYNQYYVPAILCFGVIGACYTNLAMTLSIRRHEGQLKRKRATPLPAWALLGGLVGLSILVSAVLVVITLTTGILLYDVHVDVASIPSMALVIVLGAACFCALGVAIQSVIPNADAAPAIVNAILFPLVFISGTFFPIGDETFLTKIANVFPIKHFVKGMFGATNPHVAGGLHWQDLAWLVGWLVVAAVFAIRRFRWESGRH